MSGVVGCAPANGMPGVIGDKPGVVGCARMAAAAAGQARGPGAFPPPNTRVGTPAFEVPQRPQKANDSGNHALQDGWPHVRQVPGSRGTRVAPGWFATAYCWSRNAFARAMQISGVPQHRCHCVNV